MYFLQNSLYSSSIYRIFFLMHGVRPLSATTIYDQILLIFIFSHWFLDQCYRILDMTFLFQNIWLRLQNQTTHRESKNSPTEKAPSHYCCLEWLVGRQHICRKYCQQIQFFLVLLLGDTQCIYYS